MTGGEATDRDPAALDLPPDEMRALGHRVVDLLVEHWETLRDQPPGRCTDRATLERLLRETPPDEGRDPEAVLERVMSDVLAHMGRVHHPRFFAFVPGPSNWIGVLADTLAAGTNVFAGTWFESSGPAEVELVTIDWLRAWCGMGEEAGGVFTSGGSMANLTALAVAREVALEGALEDGVLYCSDQTHSAVERAVGVLGFGADQLRLVTSDDAFRLPVDAVARAVADDRAAGRRPFCVIANAGTTNTGAVDPLPGLADLCSEEELWLHVDAAYGGAAVLCDAGRRALEGLGRADSLALDPHKWLFQPFEIGCVLVRDRRLLRDTFRVLPAYLEDVEGEIEEPNFADYGVQLTRSFRALKLWMSVQVFGLDALRAAVARGIETAERAQARLEASGRWEIVTPASLGVVTFRWRARDGDEKRAGAVTRGLVEASLADGFTLVTSTRLRGRSVLRLCTINPRTTGEDLAASLDRLEALAREIERQSGIDGEGGEG